VKLIVGSTCGVSVHRNQLKQRNPAGYAKAFEDIMVNKGVLTRYNNTHYSVHDIDWKQTPASSFDRKGSPVRRKKNVHVIISGLSMKVSSQFNSSSIGNVQGLLPITTWKRSQGYDSAPYNQSNEEKEE